ncbi:Kelch repeat-containing protein [Candidatus Leptofilum sp.]|uniref:Kelch repeat-containing protein n=1 Tax=Candidatus Leptofilum sp. TaxID=3241576 RepID=UPI003B5BC7D5
MAEKGEELSKRELEVLQCVVNGAGNKEIAATLSISQNTVKVHLRNIFTKLDVGSRTEATTAALQQGIVVLEGITSEPDPVTTDLLPEEDPTADAEPEAESIVETAVSPPQPAPTSVTPRPAFFPRWVGIASLVLALLIVVIILASQAFDEEATPTPQPTAEPFIETPITNDWLQSRPLPNARSNMALVGSGLHLYLISGETEEGVTGDVSILDTSELVWQPGAFKPTAVTDITGAELFGEIYVPGGRLADGQPTNVVEVYSPANDSWRVTTPLPTAVSGGLTLSDGSFIYLFGGWDGQNYLADAYRFDPASSSWQILPAMPTARAFVAGGVIKGQLYVVGGYDGERPLTNCAYFDPTASGDGADETDGRWHSCADTLLPRAGASAVGLFNKLYMFGGGAFGEEPITYSESYNPDADQWSVVNTPQLNERPSWHHLGITYIETNIYAAGGRRGSTASAELFVYRPLAYQTFIPIAPVESGGGGGDQ